MSGYFYEQENESLRDYFTPDVFTLWERKILLVFLMGILAYLAPVEMYRVVFQFQGDAFYIEYLRKCILVSCLATYLLLRGFLFIVRWGGGILHKGPRF